MAYTYNTESAVIRHLKKERDSILGERLRERDPIPGFKTVNPNVQNSLIWDFIMIPTKAPYKNHGFAAQIEFSEYYPIEPPLSITIKTKIYHPNVDKDGRVYLDICAPENWRKNYDIPKILNSLMDLINNPQSADARRPDVAALLISDKAKFLELADACTKRYGAKQPLVQDDD